MSAFSNRYGQGYIAVNPEFGYSLRQPDEDKFYLTLYNDYQKDYPDIVSAIQSQINNSRHVNARFEYLYSGNKPRTNIAYSFNIDLSAGASPDKRAIVDIIIDHYLTRNDLPITIASSVATIRERNRVNNWSERFGVKFNYMALWLGGGTSEFNHSIYNPKFLVPNQPVIIEVGEFDIELADDMPIVVGYNDIELVD